MSRRLRYALFGASAAVVAGVFVWGLTGLPDFGHYRGPYGTVLNGVAVSERHATNVVAAVVFDYRGLDTMGEEFILFMSVMGVALLARHAREHAARRPVDLMQGDAVRALGLGIVAPTILLGLYVVAHGYVTPGGGFQGGVVVATGFVLVYLAGSYGAFCRLSPVPLVDLAEGGGIGGYAVIGAVALLLGAAFLHNLLPLGRSGTVASAGSIAMLNAATGLAVAAAFVLLFREFLEEYMDARREAPE